MVIIIILNLMLLLGKRLCTAFQKASDTFCDSLCAVARRLAASLAAFISSFYQLCLIIWMTLSLCLILGCLSKAIRQQAVGEKLHGDTKILGFGKG